MKKILLLCLTLFLALSFSQEGKPKHRLQYEEVIQGMDFEDVKLLLKTALDGRNMNVLGVIDVATEKPRFSYILVCNLSYAERIFREFPQLGVMAPCRIYLHEREDGSVAVGFVNVKTLLKVFDKYLSPQAKELFLKADNDVKSAIKEVKGEQ
ncbi:uncharacterized protein (DUF302 family) [Hydrogenivirga caldilitoris]|uniref:Uncharacterized protein (DUF302 family) n=1 Tax=Hydrogenivirga caldilitoris TaxID=246264 RepID=A0A497XR95_9AQUI|nr:DUF302 domain-containing protein [Hydrogenivirga caldilitoris]RLJ71448.1 uncharacterized protein (DUF302 family) [Hydrogenivirga caldilitoris]